MPVDMYNQSIFLVLKAAYLYYIENLSQNEIAQRLKISITTVSRLLKKAKEEKIVEFVIRDPYVECIHLEQALKETFALKDVVIAPGIQNGREDAIVDEKDEESVKKLVALEGARYLQRIIKDNDVLGITWGSTIYHLINYLNPAQKVGATFVTLHGSIAFCDSELDVRTLVTRISKAFSGTNYPLLTEALMSSKQTADIIKQEKNIQKVYQKFDEINIAITGTGSFYPDLCSVLAKPEFMTEEELKKLQEKNVVGDIALRFIDRDGKECETDLRDRMISIDLEKYKKIDTKITIASGSQKAQTVLSELKGKLIDVLIVDYELGMEIMRLKKLEDEKQEE
ncbi:MAG: sugar-binding transcriptional regulator [Lachnospiraceae bacterium]|nr:sugar-binding transcriptional regulator [Lachnospiraceae bacterium]